MMLQFTRPTPETIAAYVAARKDQEWTYDFSKLAADEAPKGYKVDHRRVAIGHGPADFAAARRAIEQWRCGDLGWVFLAPDDHPPEVGHVVAVVAKSLGLWWMNACRVRSVLDETDPHPRYGFAHGTLHDHIGRGEERFLVEMTPDGTVWYDLRAYSKPSKWFSRAGYWFMWGKQRQFGHDSCAAMTAIVAAARTNAPASPPATAP